jgi:hypothetical protein
MTEQFSSTVKGPLPERMQEEGMPDLRHVSIDSV